MAAVDPTFTAVQTNAQAQPPPAVARHVGIQIVIDIVPAAPHVTHAAIIVAFTA